MFTKSFSIISLILICLFVGITGFVFAEENNEIILNDQDIIFDENITANDLEISEQKILPDSPFYFLKNIRRSIQSIFTFNPIKKAELKLKFTNERLMEIKKLSEISPEKTEILNKALENYKSEMAKTEQAVKKIKKTIDNEKVNKFMNKFIDHNIKHQKLFKKLEKKVPEQAKEAIRNAQQNSLKRLHINLENITNETEIEEKDIQNIKEKIKNKIKNFKEKNINLQETNEEK